MEARPARKENVSMETWEKAEERRGEWQDMEALLAKGSMIRVKPRGYSMYPLFVPGRDEAVIAPLEEKKLRRGDVALYRREEGILVLHRIWKSGPEGFYMVGDNQREIEGPLEAGRIKGVLVGVVRKGRHFSVKNPLYRILSAVWLLLRPFRPFLSGVAARLKRKWGGGQ